MLLLSQLPKFNTHLAAALISLASPSPYARSSHYLLPKSNYYNKPSSYSFRALKSTLASHIPSLNDDVDVMEDDEPETPVELSIEKLFIPPETEVSSSMMARVLKGSNIVLSKYARDAQVTTAEFVKSSVKTEDCPAEGLPEFALVGRSNVGKSSLLNSIVKRKKLALISKKPGKTQCINHFRINDSWFLVDLPGYGFAAAPHEIRTDWAKFTKDYFLNRPNLVSVFLLVDASIPAKKIDLEYASWLGENQIPMTLIFTKCDKRKRERMEAKGQKKMLKSFKT